jgi:xanthine dehydrogenase small subunit
VDFILNGERQHGVGGNANTTLLDYLRDTLALKGTKEGCASGDCGACTVVVATADGLLRAVNACITPLGNLHQRQVFTVEALAASGGGLHPVQQAMVDCHGSQCGFCTPGFVMALTALYHNGLRRGVAEQHRDAVTDAISGNLCRCTGYRPIIEAGTKMLHSALSSSAQLLPVDAMPRFAAVAEDSPVLEDGEHAFYQPQTEAQLQALLTRYPNATLVAGATDLGLELTQRHRQFSVLISLTAVQSLQQWVSTADYLQIGAALPYTDLEHHMAGVSLPFVQLLHRLGSRQIRNQGTVGGNLANGSPIADTPPVLLAWDAEVEIVSRNGQRAWHPLSAFYLGYRKTLLQPGQYLAAMRIPQTAIARPHRFYKLSKRFEDDISAVMGAFSVQLEQGRVSTLRIAFGGVAATPIRAPLTETLLQDQLLTDAVLTQACEQLAAEIAPISDVRASSAYRTAMACNLLRRALLELRDGVVLEVHHYSIGQEAALYAQTN